MSLLHRGHASLLQAAACSLLTQSCILLYDGDGSQGGSSQGGNGGQAGGAVHSSSATGTGGGGNASGGGGNGGEGGSGAFSCGAMEGAFPLVDVGQFGSLTEAAIQGIQALAPGPDGSVVAAAFSGPGFTTSGGCTVDPQRFFLLHLNAQGQLAKPLDLQFMAAGEQPVISLARGPNNGALLVAMSRSELLQVHALTPDLKLEAEQLSCFRQDAKGDSKPLLQGRLVSNGTETALVASLAADGAYQCIVQGAECPIAAGKSRILLWSPNGPEGCEQLRYLEPTTPDEAYSNPRLALGPPGGPGGTEAIVTLHSSVMNGPPLHKSARALLLADGTFSVWSVKDLGPQRELVLPAIPEASKGMVGGVVGTTVPPGPPAAFLRFEDTFAGIPENDTTPITVAPPGGTKTHITAMSAAAGQVLVMAEVDQAGATVLGDFNSSCDAQMALCGLWSVRDTSLGNVRFHLTPPRVFPTAGILLPANPPTAAQAVLWAGRYSTNFTLADTMLDAPPAGTEHIFIALQQPPGTK